jgi:hypothetical protein
MKLAALACWMVLVIGLPASAGITLKTPKTRQIVQRNQDNMGSFTVSGVASSLTNLDRIEARLLVMPGATNNGVSTDWVVLVNSATNGEFSGTITNISAGGWYRLDIRALDAAGNELATNSVTRLGVGDILITAGQSNAACAGYPPQVPSDDRVSTYSLYSAAANTWRFASDPQPDNSGGMGTGGSPWPILGSLLVSSNHVPVGLVCVAYGGTAVSQWVPGSGLYRNLTNALRSFAPNGVRAVLWHQGESDAAYQTTAAAYSQMLSNIVVQSRATAGWSVPWGIAEAAYLPGNTLSAQEAVMAGQRRCIYSVPHCFRGARTEDFHLEGKLSDVVHFNGTGLAEHAQMWANALLGIEDLTVKNGNFEANAPLSDGKVVNSIEVIGWNMLNAAGDRGAGGYGGYMNPSDLTYLNSGDTNNGGVLPNMNGRHVATLYGIGPSSPAGDAFLQTLRAHLQPSTLYTLQAAIGLRSRDSPGGYRLDILTNGVPMGPGASGDASTLNLLAGGSATNTFTLVSCVIASPVSVAPNQQVAIRISKPKGGLTYLDFDDVRLTARVDHPPVADASASKATVVSANGTDASVLLDGSRSHDADNDPLQYSWFEGNTLVASGVVAIRNLPLGPHAVSLVVSDGFLADTNRITIAVLTPAQAVQRLIASCDAKASRPQPLRAALSAALAAINRGASTPAVNQFLAFQNKVRAQVSPEDPAFAAYLAQASQEVIDALGGRLAHDRPAIAAVHQDSYGKAHMQIIAAPQTTYIIQASSNLLDWEMVGVLKVGDDGSTTFNDALANRFTQRFYRLIEAP